MSEDKPRSTSDRLFRIGVILAVTAFVEYVEWQSMPYDSSFTHPATFGCGIGAVLFMGLAGLYR